MFDMLKRVWSSKNQQARSTSKSLRFPDPMLEALDSLAQKEGETLNSYVVLILDQYLQIKLAEQTKDLLDKKTTAS